MITTSMRQLAPPGKCIPFQVRHSEVIPYQLALQAQPFDNTAQLKIPSLLIHWACLKTCVASPT